MDGSHAEIILYQIHYINTMAADALNPSYIRPSAVMVVTMQDTRLAFNKEGFQLPASSQ